MPLTDFRITSAYLTTLDSITSILEKTLTTPSRQHPQLPSHPLLPSAPLHLHQKEHGVKLEKTHVPVERKSAISSFLLLLDSWGVVSLFSTSGDASGNRRGESSGDGVNMSTVGNSNAGVVINGVREGACAGSDSWRSREGSRKASYLETARMY